MRVTAMASKVHETRKPAASSRHGSVYKFMSCEIDKTCREIRANGSRVDVQPKVFDLLIYLIENRDRMVDKDELLTKIWPGSIVTESSLSQAIRKARSIVGDDGDHQHVIRPRTDDCSTR